MASSSCSLRIDDVPAGETGKIGGEAGEERLEGRGNWAISWDSDGI